MNKKTLKVLEYYKIIELLKNEADSDVGREIISELVPLKDPRIIEHALDETGEATRLIIFKGPLPLGNFYDVKNYVTMAQKGGTLAISELLKVLYNMKISRDVKKYIGDDVPDLPIIADLIEVIETFKNLEEDLDKSIENEEEISDNASAELRRIRRSIVRQNDSIKARIHNIITRSDNRSVLQDAIVTVRDGRYVIPVKQEHKSKVPGIIHDQSGSGATVFIEPQTIVNMNNELRELELSEQAEIAKIIKELSQRVGEVGRSLINNQDILAQLDVIMAKGKLAQKQNAERPQLSKNRVLDLKSARHPLIDEKKVVPIDIKVGNGYDALIVTGPNTGGKTVTLKTAGLLSMMAQTGLHIPATSQSKIPVYREIFADIGDEQSIEQSLSTFSSHMKNIVEIVEEAGENTLVLLDELGAGTDPAEGAALAISILESLRVKGATILATTHYTELKKYALKEDGVENASMEFDVATLSPTYVLEIGVPGKSNAFEISSKLGLSSEIIEKSRSFLDKGDIAFEEVISAIENDKKQAEMERDEAIALNVEIHRQKRQMEEKLEKAKKQEEKMLSGAREEARKILREAKEVAKKAQDEIKDLAKVESLGERNRRLENAKRKIKDAAGRYRETFIIEENQNPISIDDVEIGDRVKVLKLGQNGEIVGLPDGKGEIPVQVGMMKIKCKAKDLKIIADGRKKIKPKTKANYGSLYKGKTQGISRSVNVRGENLHDALNIAEKYIDDAFMAKLKEITIIHGRGEGVLKKGIHDMLKGNKQVDSYRYGEYNEGGHGVTIVTLKQ